MFGLLARCALLLVRRCGLHAQLRLLGLVLEDQAFQHRLRGLAFFFVELLQCLELQAQGVVGAAFVLIEYEVCRR